jgi:predicted DNA-binding protein with PD1-like motif
MKHWTTETTGRVVFLRLDKGEDLLEGIQAALREHQLRDGMVISGIATVSHCRLHQVQGTDYPAVDKILELDGPLEVMNISGISADGALHLHATVADQNGRAYGGHVEPGCTVLYLAEIAVLEAPDAKMTRERSEHGIFQLVGGDGNIS